MPKNKSDKAEANMDNQVDEGIMTDGEVDPKLLARKKKKLPKEFYEKELFRFQVEMVKLQEWIKEKT
jgi:polyphosphate kinase 2 (PPK2 family)